MAHEPDDLLPASYLAQHRGRPPLSSLPSPLPAAVVEYYTTGGCWILALALHQATGLPIEVCFRSQVPQHAYVVAGQVAIDALGARNLRDARAGFDDCRTVSLEELVALRQGLGPEGRIDTDDGSSDSVEAARRTAQVILGLLRRRPA